MIYYGTAQSEADLQGILTLQKQNLPGALSQEEIASQGFVTVLHTPELLRQMNDIEPHVIAKDGDAVVAYLLAMTAASRQEVPVLIPMFETFDNTAYEGKLLADYHYLVVGQVCVKKEYRGQGILEACYQTYRDHFRNKYDFAITEIAAENKRSLRAHERVGFREIHRYKDPDGVEWSIVILRW